MYRKFVIMIIGFLPFLKGDNTEKMNSFLTKMKFLMSKYDVTTSSNGTLPHSNFQLTNDSYPPQEILEGRMLGDQISNVVFRDSFVNIQCSSKESYKSNNNLDGNKLHSNLLSGCNKEASIKCENIAKSFKNSTNKSISCQKHTNLSSMLCVQNLVTSCHTPFDIRLHVQDLFQTNLIGNFGNQSFIFLNVQEIKNIPILTLRSPIFGCTSDQCEMLLNTTGISNYIIRMLYKNQTAVLVRGFEEVHTMIQKISQMPGDFQIELVVKMKTAHQVWIKNIVFRNCEDFNNSFIDTKPDKQQETYQSCSFTSGLCSWLYLNNINDTCHFTVLSGLDVAQTRKQALLDNTHTSFVGKLIYLHGRECYMKSSSFRTILYSQIQKGDNSSCKVKFSVIGTLPLRVFIVYPIHNKYVSLWNQSNTIKEWISQEVTLIDNNEQSVFYLLFETAISKDKYRDYVAVDDIIFSKGCNLEDRLDISLMQVGVKSSSKVIDILIPVIVCSSFLAMMLAVIAVVSKMYGRNTVMRKGHSLRKIPVKWACLDTNEDIIPPSVTISNFCNIEDFLTKKNPNYEWYNGRILNNKLTDIPRDKLTISNKIGNGAFGEVYSGILLQDYPVKKCRHVAVKTVLQGSSERAKVDFFLEALTLSKFAHPNIVEFLGVSVEKASLLLVLEYMPGGDLKNYLRSLRSGKFDDVGISCNLMLDMCIDVARACKYLEEIKFVHRDIAARNCLLSSKRKDMVVKIADFGLARDILSSEYYRKTGSAMLPVRWMSPESFTEGIFSSKSDVWSFGVLMWEIFSYAQMPYEGYSNTNVITLILAGKQLTKPTLCKTKVYDIMCLCWKTNPTDRPSFSELLCHLETVKKLQQNELHRSPKIHVRQKRLNSYICDQ